MITLIQMAGGAGTECADGIFRDITLGKFETTRKAWSEARRLARENAEETYLLTRGDKITDMIGTIYTDEDGTLTKEEW